jgi:hypothetical protein
MKKLKLKLKNKNLFQRINNVNFILLKETVQSIKINKL